MPVPLFVFLLAASFFLHWLESLWGRTKLRDHLDRQGWDLRSARWQPRWPKRLAQFRFEAERAGERATGTAFVGGDWSGPVWSRALDIEWNSASGLG